MNNEFTPKNIENDESNLNFLESDYKKLINKLEDISSTIALLEKQFLDNI